MLSDAFSKSKAKPFPLWGGKGILVDISDVYDEYYEPKTRPQYTIEDGMIYDPVSGLYIPLSKLLYSRIDPTDKNFSLSAMDIALIKGDNAAVIGMADNLLKADPKDTSAMCAKAIALSSEGNIHASLELNTQILQIDANNAAALNNRALDYLSLGRVEDALADIKKSIACDREGFIPSYGIMAEALFKLGRPEDALDALEEGLSIKKEGVLPPLQLKALARHIGCDDPEEALSRIRRMRNDKGYNPFAPSAH